MTKRSASPVNRKARSKRSQKDLIASPGHQEPTPVPLGGRLLPPEPLYGFKRPSVILVEGQKIHIKTFPDLAPFLGPLQGGIPTKIEHPHDLRQIRFVASGSSVPSSEPLLGIEWTRYQRGVLIASTNTRRIYVCPIFEAVHESGGEDSKPYFGFPQLKSVDLGTERVDAFDAPQHISPDGDLALIAYSQSVGGFYRLDIKMKGVKAEDDLAGTISLISPTIDLNGVTQEKYKKVHSFACDVDLRRIAVSNGSYAPFLINTADKSITVLPVCREPLLHPVWRKPLPEDNEDQLVFSSAQSGNIMVYSLPVSDRSILSPSILNWHAHPLGPRGLAFDPRTRDILSAGEEGVVMVWSQVVGVGGRQKTAVPKVGGVCTAVVPGPIPGWLLTLRGDNRIISFDSQSSREYSFDAAIPLPITVLQHAGLGHTDRKATLPESEVWSYERIPFQNKGIRVRPIHISKKLGSLLSIPAKSYLTGPFDQGLVGRHGISEKQRIDIGGFPMISLTDVELGKTIFSESLNKVRLDEIPQRFMGGNHNESRPMLPVDTVFWPDRPLLAVWMRRKKVTFDAAVEGPYAECFRVLQLCPSDEGSRLPLKALAVEDISFPHAGEIIYFDLRATKDPNGYDTKEKKSIPSLISADTGGIIKVWTPSPAPRPAGPAASSEILQCDRIIVLPKGKPIREISIDIDNGLVLVLLESSMMLMFDIRTSQPRQLWSMDLTLMVKGEAMMTPFTKVWMWANGKNEDVVVAIGHEDCFRSFRLKYASDGTLSGPKSFNEISARYFTDEDEDEYESVFRCVDLQTGSDHVALALSILTTRGETKSSRIAHVRLCPRTATWAVVEVFNVAYEAEESLPIALTTVPTQDNQGKEKLICINDRLQMASAQSHTI